MTFFISKKNIFIGALFLNNVLVFAENQNNFEIEIITSPKITYSKNEKIEFSLDIDIAKEIFSIPFSYQYSTKWNHNINIIIQGIPFFSFFENNFPFQFNAFICLKATYYITKSSLGFEIFYVDLIPKSNITLITGVKYIKRDNNKIYYYIGFNYLLDTSIFENYFIDFDRINKSF